MSAPATPARGREERKRVTMGSQVSTKQIAWAAVNGRLVKFSTTVGDQAGYVIGQDDFHWVIATVPQSSTAHQTALIHKGSAAVVTITDQLLDSEPDPIVSSITMAGSAFWSYCRSTFPNI
jgi:hypothetical protein